MVLNELLLSGVGSEPGWLQWFSCCLWTGEDTGRVVHVRLRRVEVRMSAEQLRNQRQHQSRVTGAQKLQTPEQRKEKHFD